MELSDLFIVTSQFGPILTCLCVFNRVMLENPAVPVSVELLALRWVTPVEGKGHEVAVLPDNASLLQKKPSIDHEALAHSA